MKHSKKETAQLPSQLELMRHLREEIERVEKEKTSIAPDAMTLPHHSAHIVESMTKLFQQCQQHEKSPKSKKEPKKLGHNFIHGVLTSILQSHVQLGQHHTEGLHILHTALEQFPHKEDGFMEKVDFLLFQQKPLCTYLNQAVRNQNFEGFRGVLRNMAPHREHLCHSPALEQHTLACTSTALQHQKAQIGEEQKSGSAADPERLAQLVSLLPRVEKALEGYQKSFASRVHHTDLPTAVAQPQPSSSRFSFPRPSFSWRRRAATQESETPQAELLR